jgi:hypothetical protein
MDDQAEGGWGVLIFVLAVIVLALVATWGVLNLNVWATVIGGAGEVALFFIFWLGLK